MRKEDTIAMQLATYLNMQYPNIIYHFDTGSGGVQSIGMAMRNKRLNKWRGWPDLIIMYPSGKYHALLIELKAENPYKKNGELKSSEHLQEQNDIHLQLSMRGYKAVFGVGFEGCRKIIDEYLK